MVIHPNHLSPEIINRATGKHGEPSLATHRAQPHPGQLRYQYRKTCGSRRCIILLDNQYSPAEHCPCLTMYTPCRSYTIRLSVPALCAAYDTLLFFLRARVLRASPRGLCGTRFFSNDWSGLAGMSTEASGCTASLCTPEKLVSPDVPAVSSRYCTAIAAVPFGTELILSPTELYSLFELRNTGPYRLLVWVLCQAVIPSAE